MVSKKSDIINVEFQLHLVKLKRELKGTLFNLISWMLHCANE